MKMRNRISVAAITLVLALTTPGAGAHSPPGNAKVYFIGLADGAVVESPFKVQFGISGFGITPAGTTGRRRHTAGHHHLLVDVDQLPDLDEPIPRDSRHIHFDRAETEALLELRPGRHTLQLLLGDEQHEPQDPPLISEKITIIVE
ncbi:MAG: DUF4399 domain-containing protein [Gammaproteobacteria bacterium]|nr:DUF4399 domain-containing protein [Gammaproteobacteria bacterium]HXK56525.1 DUF4399 domain-containing protein [Gammaproteobacteria bacterium]